MVHAHEILSRGTPGEQCHSLLPVGKGGLPSAGHVGHAQLALDVGVEGAGVQVDGAELGQMFGYVLRLLQPVLRLFQQAQVLLPLRKLDRLACWLAVDLLVKRSLHLLCDVLGQRERIQVRIASIQRRYKVGGCLVGGKDLGQHLLQVGVHADAVRIAHRSSARARLAYAASPDVQRGLWFVGQLPVRTEELYAEILILHFALTAGEDEANTHGRIVGGLRVLAVLSRPRDALRHGHSLLGDEDWALIAPPVKALLLQGVGVRLQRVLECTLDKYPSIRNQQYLQLCIKVVAAECNDHTGPAAAIAELQHYFVGELSLEGPEYPQGQAWTVHAIEVALLWPKGLVPTLFEDIMSQLLVVHKQSAVGRMGNAIVTLEGLLDVHASTRELGGAAVPQLQDLDALPRWPVSVVLQVNNPEEDGSLSDHPRHVCIR
mmetsp:Transcript_91297/g.267228  ORF Transcript_91297/g.267228 Transcript_91297/m.267228 type:complete len:432 (+) Transcript_91297:268-1563(+)